MVDDITLRGLIIGNALRFVETAMMHGDMKMACYRSCGIYFAACHDPQIPMRPESLPSLPAMSPMT